MRKSKTTKYAEKNLYQKIKPYLTLAVVNEFNNIIKAKRRKVYICADGHLFILEQVCPAKMRFVVLVENIESAKIFLREIKGGIHLFQTISGNMLQKTF